MPRRSRPRTLGTVALTLGALLAAALFPNAACAQAEPPPAPTAARAIIVVIDGPRASECMDDPEHANIPNLWNEIRPLGVFSKKFRNEGKTLTNPGHAAILTGCWQNLDNDGTEHPHRPTLFEYYRRARPGTPAERCYLVASKGKLAALAHSDDDDYGPGLGAAVDAPLLLRKDADTLDALLAVLSKKRPDLVLVNLAAPDVCGHAGDWDGYVAGIREADRIVKAVWDAVEADPHYKGKTALFVTADHGRHPDGHKKGYTSHGDSCEGCRRIPFFALGAGIKAGGVEVDRTRSQIDIAPTVGRLLGFATPDADGSVMVEVLAPAAPPVTGGEPVAKPAEVGGAAR